MRPPEIKLSLVHRSRALLEPLGDLLEPRPALLRDREAPERGTVRDAPAWQAEERPELLGADVT